MSGIQKLHRPKARRRQSRTKHALTSLNVT